VLAIRRWGRGVPGDIAAAFDAAGFNRGQFDLLIDMLNTDLMERRA